MAEVNGRSATGIYFNGATIMTTRTDRHRGRPCGRLRRRRGPCRATPRRARRGPLCGRRRPPGRGLEPERDAAPAGARWTARPRTTRGRTAATARDLSILGAAYLLVVPPRAPGAEVAPSVAAMRDGLARIRDAVAPDGIGTAFEFLGSGIARSTRRRSPAEVVSRPGVELVLDSCHWHASGAGSLDPFPVDRLAMVHLNDAPAKPPREIEDADRVLPGSGVIGLPELVADLSGRGYRGPWSLETFNPTYWADDPNEIATTDLVSCATCSARRRQEHDEFALLGAGRIGQLHGRLVASQPDVTEVIVADVDPRRAQEAAEAIGGRTAAGAAEAWTRPTLRSSRPRPMRIPHSCRCRSTGTFRSSARSRWPSISTSRSSSSSGRAVSAVFQLGFQRRFDPAYVEARRLVENGGSGPCTSSG